MSVLSCAGTAKEAIRAQQATPAELVITDILMPEKDGVAAGPLGTIATVRKPFDLDVMLETVRQALAA